MRLCSAQPIVGSLFVLTPETEATSLSASMRSQQVTIVPGNAEIERGSSLVVTARFDGSVPDQAELICETADGSERRITMTQNLKDPVVGGFVPSVDQPFTVSRDHARLAERTLFGRCV